MPPQTPPTWGMFSGYQIQYLCRDLETTTGDRKGNGRGVRILIESVTGSMRWSASQQTFHRILEWRAHTSKRLKESSNEKAHEPNGAVGHVQEISFLEILIFENYIFELKYLGDVFCTPKKGRRMWDMWQRSMCDPKPENSMVCLVCFIKVDDQKGTWVKVNTTRLNYILFKWFRI